jgi:thioredoxin reductase (NADPH)
MGKPKRTELVTGAAIVGVTEHGQKHKLDVLYPALGSVVRSELATALGAGCNENGNLIVDDHQRTSVDRPYAAGDVVTDLHQLSVAFGHAAIAATDIHSRLPHNPS